MPAVLSFSLERDGERENATGKSLLHQPRLQGTYRVRQRATDVIKGLVHPNYKKLIFLFTFGCLADRIWVYVSW